MNKSKMFGEVDAVYKVKKELERVKITCSNNVNDFIRSIYPTQIEYREAFVCLYLDRSNHTIGYSTISTGGVAGTACDPKLIFQFGLLCNASAIVLIHNHPSGNLKPSEADLRLTKRVKSVGKEMEMPVLDHLILTSETYFSFADDGIL